MEKPTSYTFRVYNSSTVASLPTARLEAALSDLVKEARLPFGTYTLKVERVRTASGEDSPYSTIVIQSALYIGCYRCIFQLSREEGETFTGTVTVPQNAISGGLHQTLTRAGASLTDTDWSLEPVTTEPGLIPMATETAPPVQAPLAPGDMSKVSSLSVSTGLPVAQDINPAPTQAPAPVAPELVVAALVSPSLPAPIRPDVVEPGSEEAKQELGVTLAARLTELRRLVATERKRVRDAIASLQGDLAALDALQRELEVLGLTHLRQEAAKQLLRSLS